MSVGVVAGTLVVATLIGEVFVRYLDGYRLTTMRLIPLATAGAERALQRRDVARTYLPAIPPAPGMRIDWFEQAPAPPAEGRAVDPVLREAARRFADAGIEAEAVHVFNWQFARGRLCSDPHFSKFPGFIFLFDPAGGSEHPRYRFPRNVRMERGLVTNRFGWRGADLTFAKPPRTVRLAFVGASTTVNNHGFPFSYPELVGHWLNLWLAELGLDLRVEVINAGREGIASTDIAAVVRDEVLPMQPDMVVYYEGANQFHPRDIIRERHPGALRLRLMNILSHGEPYSAIVQRVSNLVRFGLEVSTFLPTFAAPAPGSEPVKPPYEVVWPDDVDEGDPPLAHPKLPSNLSVILRDLDDMQARVRAQGGDFVLSSFFWLVFDGMRLDPARDRMLFDYLNRHYHPFRYREMARLAAFQNNVLRRFAVAHDLYFIDVAAAMPRDPNLFLDAIHATYDGIRLHAWIVAQELAPLLQQRIAEGRLARPAKDPGAQHPAFVAPERTALIACDGRAADAPAHSVVRSYATGLAVPP